MTLAKETENSKDILMGIYAVSRYLHNCENEDEAEISLARARVIHLLSEAASMTSTMTEIATELNIRGASLTYLIEKLVNSGYVERIHDEQDRRLVKISLTAKGKAQRESIWLHKTERFLELLKSLTPEEVQQLQTAVNKLVAATKSV